MSRFISLVGLLACGRGTTPSAPGDTDPPSATLEYPTFTTLNTHPCALDVEGALRCWGWDDRFPAFDRGPYIGLSSVDDGRGRVIDTNGAPRDLGADSQDWPHGPVEAMPHSWTGVGTDGRIHTVYAEFWPSDEPWSVITDQGLATALSPDGTLRRQYAPGVSNLIQYSVADPQRIVDVSAMGTDGACVLDEEGEITCFGSGSEGVFTSPPYRLLEGGAVGACAVREADGRVECTTGDFLELGDVRVLAVGDPPPISVCAITTDNAINCYNTNYYRGMDLPTGHGD